MKIFLEASGCLTANFLISAIKDAGHICVASDANPESIGKLLSDEFYTVPMATDTDYVEKVLEILIEHKIVMVIPTLDDALLKWASMREQMEKNNITLAISDTPTLNVCVDKWNTYQCFIKNGIPTPKSSLKKDFPLVKPRNGRGGSGIVVTDDTNVNMDNMICQELLLGTEYTVDVFCDYNHDPVYIVPRVRAGVKDGKSTGGVVCQNKDIDMGVRKICKAIPFTGAINIQCFETKDGIRFTEINPRFGGGTVLGMKATENWIPLTIDTFCYKKRISQKKDIHYGLKMGRYYAEIFYE